MIAIVEWGENNIVQFNAGMTQAAVFSKKANTAGSDLTLTGQTLTLASSINLLASTSSSTITTKAICKPAFVSRDQSDTESLDDEALKNKIQEANQLIIEVKKALVKIKAVKNCDTGGKSSSTDIEETIKNLKKETAQLITGNENEFNVDSMQPEEPRKTPEQNAIKDDIPSYPNQVPCEDHISSSDVSLTQPEEPGKSQEPDVIEEDIPGISKKLPCEDLISFSQECIRKSSEKIPSEDDIRKQLDKLENERPKTRRNETEDELSEQLRREKFRTCPETGTLNMSSSFEQLQEKLQTISETTESNYSTPRKKSIDPVPERNSTGCNTTHSIEHKEIQVKPQQTTVGVCFCCSTKDKNIQVTPQKHLTMETTTGSSPSPNQRLLDSTHLPVQEIKPISKSANYRIEQLPAIETVATSTENKLRMEHVPAVSLPTKVHQKMLTIQRLPDIIIKPDLVLTPVLKLSISPVGQSENCVKNTDNIQYVEIVHRFLIDEEKEVSCGKSVKCTSREDTFVLAVRSKKSLEKATKSMSKMVKSQNEKWSDLLKSHRFSKNEATEFLKDYESGLDSERIIKLTAEEEERMLQRLAYYKSYHIYDNPNKHDPGELAAKSISKFSQMDIDVYKTFINPNPNVADEDYFAASPRNQANRSTKYSFESKTVQCSDSEVIGPKVVPVQSDNYEEIKLKAESSKIDKATSTLKIKSEEGMKEVQFSQAPKELPETVLIAEEKSEDVESAPTAKKCSLSEITLTISYTLSSDSSKNSTGISEKEISGSELKVTTAANSSFSDITRTFSVADKDIISKLQNKLKSIDTEDSNPIFKMNKNSENCDTLDNFIKGLTYFEEREVSENTAEPKNKDEQRRENRENKDEKDTENGPSQEPSADMKPENNPTVNYLIQQKMLEDPYTHLELGKNGRYKDEEDLFTNMRFPNENSIKSPLYPKDIPNVKTISVTRDREVALDKFKTKLRDRLNRYSPDTSNSETVTTNSVSEGEIPCRHSISNGEIHVCRPKVPIIPRSRLSKSSIAKRHLSYTPKYRCPHSHCRKVSPRRFDLNDPTVSIEQRRNYFNNWVTYYVQSQGVRKKSTPNCNNKQQ